MGIWWKLTISWTEDFMICLKCGCITHFFLYWHIWHEINSLSQWAWSYFEIIEIFEKTDLMYDILDQSSIIFTLRLNYLNVSGERLIQFATENLVTEVLIHPQVILRIIYQLQFWQFDNILFQQILEVVLRILCNVLNIKCHWFECFYMDWGRNIYCHFKIRKTTYISPL